MPYFTSKGVGIVGMAAAVPKNKVDSGSFKERFDEAVIDKFVKSTGIGASHQTLPNQTASDLGFAAAENLLNSLHIDRKKIGILVFVTLSPDYRKPATSCVLQKRLGLPTYCACMDVGHGCAGFVYGNQVMQSLMMGSDAELGLLVLGETTSKVISKGDHNSMMFGDAGAAILYEHRDDEEHLSLLQADGNRFRSLIVPAGGFRDMNPEVTEYISGDGVKHSKYDMFMDGMTVFVFSTNDVPKTINEYLDKIGKNAEDFQSVFFHQANRYILQVLTKKFHLPKEKVPICLDRYGNTSSVSIPLTICDHYGHMDGGVEDVLACGFGVGLAWGVTTLRLDPKTILPILETDEYFAEGVIDTSAL